MSERKNIDSALLEEIDIQAFRPFLKALKRGDIEAIKLYLTEEKAEATGLLDLQGEEYREYSETLKNHYRGATFSIEHGEILDDQIIVDVAIEFPGGGRTVTQFFLRPQSENAKTSSQGKRWRISAERRKREGR